MKEIDLNKINENNAIQAFNYFKDSNINLAMKIADKFGLPDEQLLILKEMRGFEEAALTAKEFGYYKIALENYKKARNERQISEKYFLKKTNLINRVLNTEIIQK